MLPPRFPLGKELAVIIAAVLLMFFVSPVASWWANPALGWLTPYALWLVVILGAVLIHHRDNSDGS